MKRLTILTLLTAVCIATVMFMGITRMCDLGAPTEDIRMEDLCQGNLIPMLTGPTLWAQFPVPCLCGISFRAFWDLPAFGFVLALTLPVVLMGSRWLRWSLGTISAAVLLLGAVPYVTGWIVLSGGEYGPDVVGSWLAIMLIGAFYHSLLAAAIASVDLVPARRARLQMPGLSIGGEKAAPVG